MPGLHVAFAPSGTFRNCRCHLEVFDAEDSSEKTRATGPAAYGAQWAAFVRAHCSELPALDETPAVTQFFDELENGIAERLTGPPPGSDRWPVFIEKHQRTH